MDKSSPVSCIDQQRPCVSVDQAMVIATRLFGLHISGPASVKELQSYTDRNFYMRGMLFNEQNKDHGDCGEYVLKILNHEDSNCDSLVEAQCEAMLLLQARGHKCPTPTLSILNTPYVTCKIPKKMSAGQDGLQNDSPANSSPVKHQGKNVTNRTNYRDIHTERNLIDGIAVYNGEDQCNEHSLLCAVRLLTFVPGKVLNEQPLTAELMYEVGKAVGRLDRDLKELNIPTLNRPGFLWDLSCAGDTVERFLSAIHVQRHREMVREVCADFRKEVNPRKHLLPKQIIHGDANYDNVIVNDEEKTLGFIDFGDLNYTCRVFELAIALMYIINGDAEGSSWARIKMAGYVFAGYQSVNPLSEIETDLLYLLTASRFCQSLVYGAYTYKYIDPGNEHLIETSNNGWKNLEAFWNTPKVNVMETWFQISNEITQLEKLLAEFSTDC